MEIFAEPSNLQSLLTVKREDATFTLGSSCSERDLIADYGSKFMLKTNIHCDNIKDKSIKICLMYEGCIDFNIYKYIYNLLKFLWFVYEINLIKCNEFVNNENNYKLY